MASFARKLKRRQKVEARKSFMKDFKRAMTKFKKQVVCSVCGREPRKGESIDAWHIDKYSEKIDLICTECYTDIESEGTYEQNIPST
tara:strand:+ start:2754 stop:3014 length:261 start_codon:yes stop_codon:yes gene_type:complete